jgi:DNA-binding transcriptional MerR regulator
MAEKNPPTEKSDRAFRTISEAADAIGVPQHVLRFWETRFTQLQPLKRGGNRRYYRPGDMALLETIRAMLHDQGLTIRGAQLALAGSRERARGAARSDAAATAATAEASVPEVLASTETTVPTAAALSGAPPGAGAAVGIDRARLSAIRDRLRFALAA